VPPTRATRRHGRAWTLAIVTDSWLWNDHDDSRRGEARRRNQGQTDTALISQAESLRALGLGIRSTII
jgi:hypothetical protein